MPQGIVRKLHEMGGPRDVAAQQRKVAQADALALISLVYFLGFPAILKGWIERVFTLGFAFGLTPEAWRGDIRGRLANLKARDAIAELIDFRDNVIAHHEWRPLGGSLWVEATSDQDVGVLQTRGEHAHAHLARAGRRQGSVHHVQPVGTSEASDLNNPVARLVHGRIPYN